MVCEKSISQYLGETARVLIQLESTYRRKTHKLGHMWTLNADRTAFLPQGYQDHVPNSTGDAVIQ